MTPDHDPLAPLLAAARIDLDAGAVAGASADLARSISSRRRDRSTP